MTETPLLVSDLKTLISKQQVVLVLGAGIAVQATGGARVASWKGLLDDGVERVASIWAATLPNRWREKRIAEIRSGNIQQMLHAADEIASRLGAPGGEYSRWLKESVGELKPSHSEVIDALLGLSSPIATTNYDSLIETVSGLSSVTWKETSKVESLLRGDSEGVLHLHGYWEDPDSVVLGTESYGVVAGHSHAEAVLRALRVTKSLVFVGFGSGLQDPHFTEWRKWMRETFSDSEYRSYRLVRSSEVAASQMEHDDDERIFVLSYGDEYSDLASFLASLHPNSPPSVTRPQPALYRLPPKPDLVGRKNETSTLVASILDDSHEAIALVGSPGIGKSSVALAGLYDEAVIKKFGPQRYFVRLDTAESGIQSISEISRTLNLPPAEDPLSGVLEALGLAPTVLTLDNLETPWEQDTSGTEELLQRLYSIPTLVLSITVRGLNRPMGLVWRDEIRIVGLDRQESRALFLRTAGQRFRNYLKKLRR